jgi:peptide/nickel transport system ATP-binding protein
VISAESLSKTHGKKRALDGVSFQIERGENAAIVGASGSGKSTLARALVALDSLDGGRVLFNGIDVHRASRAEMLAVRRRMQIVFQDPGSSLDPRMRIEAILRAPLEIHQLAGPTPAEMLHKVGLSPELLSRRPHELSGGQKQRVSIARALSLSPEVLVLDEVTSALDRSTEGELLALFSALKKEQGLTYVFISHDLRLVRAFASRVMVMFQGRIVEDKAADVLFSSPEHDHTRALLRAEEQG